MGRRAGSADLPLHGGHVLKWLGDRMTRLGTVITEAIVLEYGRDEFLRRLAHPFWFQSFGAVMGMDWHSSGITTSVLGALNRGLEPLSGDLRLYICGDRGKHSRATPGELLAVGDSTGIDGAALLVAKIDSAAVQDAFDLYLHGFIVSADGKWVIVRQGMTARASGRERYHWLIGKRDELCKRDTQRDRRFCTRQHRQPDGYESRRVPRRAAYSIRGVLHGCRHREPKVEVKGGLVAPLVWG